MPSQCSIVRPRSHLSLRPRSCTPAGTGSRAFLQVDCSTISVHVLVLQPENVLQLQGRFGACQRGGRERRPSTGRLISRLHQHPPRRHTEAPLEQQRPFDCPARPRLVCSPPLRSTSAAWRHADKGAWQGSICGQQQLLGVMQTRKHGRGCCPEQDQCLPPGASPATDGCAIDCPWQHLPMSAATAGQRGQILTELLL